MKVDAPTWPSWEPYLRAGTGPVLWEKLRSELAAAHAAKRRRQQPPPRCHDLLAWAGHYLPEAFSLPPSPMHRWLAAQLLWLVDHRGSRLNVLAPRGSAKSTLATFAFPLWLALHQKESYIWIVSETRRQAWAHLEHVKHELTTNPQLLDDYPQAAGRGPVWRAGFVVLKNGVTLEGLGVLQALRGKRRLAHRPSLIICDDIQNDRHVLTPEGRDRTRQWFFATLLPAGSPRTNVIHLATALHPEALALELLTRPGWRSKVFRAIQSWPLRMDLWQQWEKIYTAPNDPAAAAKARAFYLAHQAEMDAGASVLWPQREDLYSLMCQRAELGPAAFDREKQNRPVLPQLCEWPAEYFHADIFFDTWPASVRLKILALDPSEGLSPRRSDYSAYILLAVTEEGLFYVQADLARRPLPQMLADGVRLYRQHLPHLFVIEANLFRSLLADAFYQEFRRQGVIPPAPLLVNHQISKHLRIRRLGPYLAAGRIRFRSQCPSTKLLVDQLRQFPFADADDGPDALAMAVRVAEDYLRLAPPSFVHPP
ncbi:MAG: phage terminase large subunit [Thermoguttaceae bacterium]|nr:phage terminase large subunit [Thermoguttaceae bacterium]MDW8079177.1 phage terminase large subunit [Thermoguttaceae bacterium]